MVTQDAPQGDSDAHHVQLLQGGDLRALAPLYERHAGEVRSMLLRTHPSLGREGADDLAQEVFLTFMDTLGRYVHQGKLRSWLYGIAIRKARAWRRRHWLHLALGKQHGLVASGTATAPDRTEERVAAALRVESVLESMPQTQREVVVLRMIQGLSGEETAQILGISENAVGTRLHRARQALEGME
jgi:RNA polymerase sigma-70 factor (ECF subfamily)